MVNLFHLYVSSLKSALQGDLTEAQNFYEQAETLKSEQGLSFSESVHPDLPYLEQALTTLLSSYDFTRCMRPNGTFYGTRGKCKSGTEAAPADRRGTGKKGGDEAEGKIAKKARSPKVGMIGEATPAQRAAAENKATQMRNRNAQADRAALARKVAKEMGEDVRSVKVAKEVERRQNEKKTKPEGRDLVALDEKWEKERLKTYKSLKGKSKQELLGILNQHKKIHGMSIKDSIRDLKGGILGAIHGNDSPSDKAEKAARRRQQLEQRRAAKSNEE